MVLPGCQEGGGGAELQHGATQSPPLADAQQSCNSPLHVFYSETRG